MPLNDSGVNSRENRWCTYDIHAIIKIVRFLIILSKIVEFWMILDTIVEFFIISKKKFYICWDALANLINFTIHIYKILYPYFAYGGYKDIFFLFLALHKIFFGEYNFLM